MFRVILSCIVLISQCVHTSDYDLCLSGRKCQEISNTNILRLEGSEVDLINDLQELSAYYSYIKKINNIVKFGVYQCIGETWNIQGHANLELSRCGDLNLYHFRSYLSPLQSNIVQSVISNGVTVWKDFDSSNMPISHINIQSPPYLTTVNFRDSKNPDSGIISDENIRKKNVIKTNDPNKVQSSCDSNCVYSIQDLAGISAHMSNKYIEYVMGSGNLGFNRSSIKNLICFSVLSYITLKNETYINKLLTQDDADNSIVGAYDSTIGHIIQTNNLDCDNCTGKNWQGIKGNLRLVNTNVGCLGVDNQSTKHNPQKIKLMGCAIDNIHVDRGSGGLDITITNPQQLTKVHFNGGDTGSNWVETTRPDLLQITHGDYLVF